MSNAIWIVLQQRAGQLHKMSFEAIRAGQELAEATGDKPTLCLSEVD